MTPCPICKTAEHVRVEPEYIGYSVHCAGCYDCDCVGDPPQFVSLRPVFYGKTEAEALQEWNDNMEAD